LSLISTKDRELIERFMKVRTADVIDALDRYNIHGYTIMPEEIRPLYDNIKMAGVALPIRLIKTKEPIPTMTPEQYEEYAANWYQNRNNADLFFKIAEPGHVLVADADGYTEVGFWGSYIALVAKDKGITGLVIDGGCRDISEIRKERFPVFCRGIGRTETIGRQELRPEHVNIPVTVGRVLVEPGDFVIGDDDGVVVVPKELADAVSKRALKQIQDDRRMQRLYLKKFGIQL